MGGSLSERATRSDVVLPPGWTDVDATWTGTLTPPKTGDYTFSLQGSGASQLLVNGARPCPTRSATSLGRWSQTIPLTAGQPPVIEVIWDPFDTFHHQGLPTVVASSLTLGWKYVSNAIADAVAAARQAKVAVVFAGDYSAESFDRPSLSFPATRTSSSPPSLPPTHHTVVVLNTGGPVFMPWLNQVAGVIEDWYPGEEDGDAIAAVLYGDVDPVGRLPVTFPVSGRPVGHRQPGPVAGCEPGLGLHRGPRRGLPVRPRHRHEPLFPFGFGLSYTHFSLTGLAVTAPEQR